MARTDLKKLPTSIGRGDFGGRELYSEFEYFNSQGIEDIWANYRYPNVDEFSELSPQEGEILKGMLTESARTILGAFKEVYLFQKDFREVYNKYKHTLSELTGVYGIDKDRKLVQTHIYVRHKENGNLFTYIVPVSADEVAYFRKISEEVYVLLETLIDGALLGLANQGGKFVPRTLLIKPEEHDPYRRIFERIRSCVCPEFSSKMIVNPPSGQDLERVNDAFRVYHIYRMERDVLNTGDILKEGLAFSR
jgi:hypothetical protein